MHHDILIALGSYVSHLTVASHFPQMIIIDRLLCSYCGASYIVNHLDVHILYVHVRVCELGTLGCVGRVG